MGRFLIRTLACALLSLCISGAYATTWIKVNGQSNGTIDASANYVITLNCNPRAEVVVAMVLDENSNGRYDPDTDKIVHTMLMLDGYWKDEDGRLGYYKETVNAGYWVPIGRKVAFVASEIGSQTSVSCTVTFQYPTTTQGISGRITNHDNTPAIDREVAAYDRSNSLPAILNGPVEGLQVSATRTDADGNYTLYVPAGGQYIVWASDDPYAFYPASFRKDVNTADGIVVSGMNFSFPYPEPPVVYDDYYTVTGTAFDEFSTPLPFVHITSGRTETWTDVQGHYSIRLPAGANYVTSSLEGFSPTYSWPLTLTGNTTVIIDMDHTPFWLAGRVVNMNTSAAIPGMTLFTQPQIVTAGGGGISADPVISGPTGKFLLWQDAGDILLTALPTTSWLFSAMYVVPMDDNVFQKVEVRPATSSISGSVRDTSNNPLRGVEVHTRQAGSTADEATAITDVYGNYYSVPLKQGLIYDIVCTKPGYVPVSVLGQSITDNTSYSYWPQMTLISSPPVLVRGGVLPSYGNAETQYTFQVIYRDLDNDPPSQIQVSISGTPHDMVQAYPEDNNYMDGAWYTYSTTLPVGDYFYSFSATDGHSVPSVYEFCERSTHYGPHVRTGWKPTNDSLSPITGTIGTGIKYAFTSKLSDRDGVMDVSYTYLLLNTATGVATNSIYLKYNVQDGKIYLKNDANTAWLGGFVPGTANVIENNQCKVYCAESTATGSGNQITIIWKIELKPSMAGKNLMEWMYTADQRGLYRDWQKMGTLKVGRTPANVSLTPITGGVVPGTKTLFTAKYSDGDGYADLSGCHLLLNTTSGVSANSVYLFYNPVQGKMYLRNDAGSGWLGGYAPGSANVIENSQCKVYCAESSVANSGTQTTVNWKVEMKASQNGKSLMEWMYVSDKAGLSDGWDKVGTIRVSQPPVNVSLTPISGSLANSVVLTFASVYSDPNGASDIAACQLLLNSTTGVSANSAYMLYDVAANKLYLRNDAGTGWLGGYSPGSANTISNSQCNLRCDLTTTSASGNNRTVNWKVELKPSQSGKTLMEWMYVTDKSALTDGWDKMGSVAVQ